KIVGGCLICVRFVAVAAKASPFMAITLTRRRGLLITSIRPVTITTVGTIITIMGVRRKQSTLALASLAPMRQAKANLA
ncbi:MAG: hypothetical protein AAGH48_10420, partial [Pseudomonadota bacterium]